MMRKWEGPVYLFFAFTLAGSSVISAKIISDKLGVFTITAASLFFALLVLLPACGKKLFQHRAGQMGNRRFLLLLQAVFGIFLFRMFLLNGVLRTSATEAGILTGATPAITAVLAMVFLKETYHWKKGLGILCTVTGVLFIQGLFSSAQGFALSHLLGNALVLGAAACESTFNILSRTAAIGRPHEKAATMHPLVQTTMVTAIALVLCVIPALWEQPVRRLSALHWGDWLALLWYGLFVTALAFVCWYAGIRRCGAFTAAAFSGMMPLTAMLLSVILLREPVGWQQCWGGMLVIGGMVWIGSGEVRRKAAASPSHFQNASHR